MVSVCGSGFQLGTVDLDVYPMPGCGLSEATPHRFSLSRSQLLPNLQSFLALGATGLFNGHLRPGQSK